ncbi:hypothetical protein [Bacteroides clarus]|nr:hypothetical protein [Bacteroides clarus]
MIWKNITKRFAVYICTSGRDERENLNKLKTPSFTLVGVKLGVILVNY